jgi:hypothetical protein
VIRTKVEELPVVGMSRTRMSVGEDPLVQLDVHLPSRFVRKNLE